MNDVVVAAVVVVEVGVLLVLVLLADDDWLVFIELALGEADPWWEFEGEDVPWRDVIDWMSRFGIDTVGRGMLLPL